MVYHPNGSTVVQQRGETAILGTGTTLDSTVGSSSTGEGSRLFSSSHLLASSNSDRSADAAARARGVARRKLQRKENARLASNPHVVRPASKDYSLRHNERSPSFPLPLDLQQLFNAATRADPSSDAGQSSRLTVDPSSMQGGLKMSYSDAHWFLTNRVGIRPKQPQVNLGAVQQFAKLAEAEIAAWLGQDIFLHPDRTQAVTLIDLNRGQMCAQQKDDLRLTELTRNPHNLVWAIADPFKRLTIHCLARVYGCASFSKDTSDGVGRQTWILKGQAQQKSTSGSASMGLQSAVGNFDTPPTTDIGSELASDLTSSIGDSSDWEASDIDEDPSSFSDVGQETLTAQVPEQPFRADNVEDDAEWADAES